MPVNPLGQEVIRAADDMIRVAEKTADALPLPVDQAAEMISCRRCGGKGYGYFLGLNSPPGDCWGCGGTGQQFRFTKDRDRNKLAMEKRQLARLRILWKAHKSAVDLLQDGVEKGLITSYHVSLVSQAVQAFKRVEISGRAQAKMVKEMGGIT